MKPNKSRILAVIALGGLMVCVPLARAQDKPAPTPPAAGGDSNAPRPPRGGRNAIYDQLDLSTEQKDKIKPILADQREKMGALRGDTSLSQEDRRAKMKEITDATDAKLKDILTADQFTKLHELRKQMGGRRGQGGGAGGTGGAPAAPPAKQN